MGVTSPLYKTLRITTLLMTLTLVHLLFSKIKHDINSVERLLVYYYLLFDLKLL